MCSTRLLKRLPLTLLTILFIASTATFALALNLERPTTEGPVIGVENQATRTISWKAIPYAKAPVGNLRWKAPAPPEKRTQALKADTFCDICTQYVDHDRKEATPLIIAGKEDCLYLNIYSPENAGPETDLPVFFWIHGGGNSIQWPKLSNLDAGILANHGQMVVVTFNYRLGPMGFFSHPALKTGNKEDDSGNFATLDQIAALKWVQANIKAFGGNPSNVTIAGESAGGQNVYCLVSSPLAKGLFHRAISQSGVIRPSTPETGITHVNHRLAKLLVSDQKAADEAAAQKIVAQMSNKEIAAYLKSKTASQILATYPNGPKRGMISFPTAYGDGHVLPENFYDALTSGRYNKVPMILGTNKEETKLFIRQAPPFDKWRDDFSLFLDPEKAAFYDKVNAYLSDGWKAMAVDGPARIMTAVEGQPPIYTYQFLWGSGGLKSILEMPFNVLLGCCHALEIDFMFGTDKASLGAIMFHPKTDTGRKALSTAMMDYWSAFAKSGNPNPAGKKLPLWQAWSNGKDAPKCLLLDADFDNAKITMTNKETTDNSIETALKNDPLQPRIQPYWDTSLFKRH